MGKFTAFTAAVHILIHAHTVHSGHKPEMTTICDSAVVLLRCVCVNVEGMVARKMFQLIVLKICYTSSIMQSIC